MFPDLLQDDVFRLESGRLWLRWPRASDAAEIARLAGDPDVSGGTARLPHPYPIDAATEFVLRARRENSEGRSAIFVVAEKRRPSVPIGAIRLDDAGNGTLVLGYWLGKPYWNRGLITEAAQAMVEFAFTWTAALEIVAVAQVGNSASQRVLEKCGFRFVEQGFEEAPTRRAPALCNRYRLGREQWLSRVSAAAPETSLEGL